MGYDSNYLLRSQKDGANVINAAPAAPIEGAGTLMVTPSLYISTVSPKRLEEGGQSEPPKLKFRAGLSATYEEFLFNSNLTNQRNVSASADARAESSRAVRGAVSFSRATGGPFNRASSPILISLLTEMT